MSLFPRFIFLNQNKTKIEFYDLPEVVRYLRIKTTLTHPSVIPMRKPDNETPLNEPLGGDAGRCGVEGDEGGLFTGGVFNAA